MGVTKKTKKAAAKKHKATVTVLSGFLGSGKTTLLKHMLTNTSGKKIAVVVNDMGEVNIDAKFVKSTGHEATDASNMVELTNGCICCTLRDDMVEELAKMVDGRTPVDHIVIESTGIGEPLPVAAAFTQPVPSETSGKTLSDLVTLDTMVTVVDLSTFESYLDNAEPVGEVFPDAQVEAKPHVHENGEEHDHDHEDDAGEKARPVAALLVEQVEFADRVLLNKRDLVSDEVVERVTNMVRKMNPTAEILETTQGVVDIDKVLATGAFDFERATDFHQWADEVAPNRKHVPETEEYGISSFMYRRNRPFHPNRLSKLLHDDISKNLKIIRMKGTVWLPSMTEIVVMLSTAGPTSTVGPNGKWLAKVPPQNLKQVLREQGVTLAQLKRGNPYWTDPRIRDRTTELVVITLNPDNDAVSRALDECLVTEEEYPATASYEELCAKFKADEDPFGLDIMDETLEEQEEEEGQEQEDEAGQQKPETASLKTDAPPAELKAKKATAAKDCSASDEPAKQSKTSNKTTHGSGAAEPTAKPKTSKKRKAAEPSAAPSNKKSKKQK